MKHLFFKTFCIVSLICFQSCFYANDDALIIEPPQQQLYEAVTMPRTDFESSTMLLASKAIEHSGKIYIKGDYLFINEPYKGFHVFNNSDPSAPINIAFLKVLGSTDLSIKDNILYINNATDLIAVKPNFDNNTIEITKRITNTFPEIIAPDNFSYHNTLEDEIIINWILTE